MNNKKVPRHVPENWLYSDGCAGSEANRIIEEIMAILARRKITIATAKQILGDTIEAIDKETIYGGDRRVDGEIIRADQSFREANEPAAHTQDGCAFSDAGQECEHNS